MSSLEKLDRAVRAAGDEKMITLGLVKGTLRIGEAR